MLPQTSLVTRCSTVVDRLSSGAIGSTKQSRYCPSVSVVMAHSAPKSDAEIVQSVSSPMSGKRSCRPYTRLVASPSFDTVMVKEAMSPSSTVADAAVFSTVTFASEQLTVIGDDAERYAGQPILAASASMPQLRSVTVPLRVTDVESPGPSGGIMH